MTADVFEIEDCGVSVKVAPLIGGDGIDLVVLPLGKRSRTVQVSVAAARDIGQAMIKAADQSEALR